MTAFFFFFCYLSIMDQIKIRLAHGSGPARLKIWLRLTRGEGGLKKESCEVAAKRKKRHTVIGR